MCAAIVGTATVAAVAGTEGGAGDDDVGYVGGPSYLDPTIAPYFLPASLETFTVAPVELISRRSDIPGDVTGGTEPSISADGRYVVFTTVVADPDAAPGEERTTVLLRDRATGDLYEVTPTLPEFTGRSSRGGVISADGCVVAVVTDTPYDVFRDDDSGGRWDVYRQFMPQCSDNPDEGGGDWELMSSPTNGEAEALNVVDPETTIALSAGGTVAAFRVVFPERFAGPDPVGTILVADATVALGASERVRAVPGLPADAATGQFRVAGQTSPALSADGRFVAYVSDAFADEQPPTWADGTVPGEMATSQVYVWDGREIAGRPRLVSAGATGEPLGGGAGEPIVNSDGRFVGFVANAELVTGGVNGECGACPANIFVLDRDVDVNGTLDEDGAMEIRAVSAIAGVLGDGDSAAPTFALDGRIVGYLTKARNLAPDAVGSAAVLVATDAQSGQTTVVSVEAGTQRPAAVVTGRPVMSANGRSALLETVAPSVLGATVIGGASAQIVAVTATPVVHIDDVDVGTTFVNVQTEQSTTVTNSGPGAFVPASIFSTSPSFLVSGGTCAVGLPVPAGESCTVQLLFNATTLGFATSQLVVSEQGVAAVTVAANVIGAGGVPKIDADPSTVVFADALAASDGETLSVVVHNVGNGPAVMSVVTIGGTHPGDFVVVSDGCSGYTVPDLGACAVRLMFHPTTSGGRSAVLLATSIDGAITRATLSGRGFYEPTISTSPASVESGARVRVSGLGFPSDVDVSVGWEGGRATLVRTDITGAFDLTVGTAGVVPGLRRVIVSDGVPAGATPRYPLLRSDGIRIAESNGGVDANSPVFG